MRKIYLLSGLLVFLISCSNDSNTETNPEKILLKKSVYTFNNGSVSDSKMAYEGNKITNWGLDKYIYTGNFITAIESRDDKGNIYKNKKYVYNNDKLDYCIEDEVSGSIYYKTTFTYNINNTISYKKTSIRKSNNEEVQTTVSGILTIENGNLIREEWSTQSDNNAVRVNEYDNKNNPFKNILGIKFLLDTPHLISANNLIKAVEVSYFGNTSLKTVDNRTYIYDKYDFPTERNGFDGNGKQDDLKTQYFY